MLAHRFGFSLKRAGLVFLSSLMMTTVWATGQKVGLSRATGRGVFNIGPSKGTLSFAPGETDHSNPLRLVYEAPSGSMVGVWTKGYPATVAAGTITAVEVFVKCQSVEQSREVSVAMEIKGDKDVQRISVPLRAGWASTPAAIDWDRVGALREVVFVVAPMGGARKGTVLFDAVFSDMKIAPKKVAGVVGVTESGARGIFNIKTAEGTVSPVIDSAAKKEVLQFTYSATAGSFVGVWTKGYPSELNAKNFNGVKAAVKGPTSLSKEVSVVLEIKGTLAVQKIALPIQPSWTMSPHLVEWSRIGDLREVVFVLAPIGGARKGSLLLDMSFVKISGVKPPVPGTFSLSDARGRGVFNMGPVHLLAEGSVYEKAMGREVQTLAISAPGKSIVGYWSKDYPASLSSRSVDGVQASLHVPDSAVGKFKGFLELKGTGKDIQRVPFPTEPGWNTIREPLDWALLGSLREAVFVVQPNPSLAQLDTTVAFELQFSKGSFIKELPKASPLPENLLALYGSSATAVAGSVYSVSQAGAMGVFNIGESEGVISKGQEEGSARQLLKFDYRCPPSTVVGIWTKDYPTELNRETIDGVVIGVYVPKETQPSEINVSLELKGDKVQLVPLTLQPGWNVVRQAIQWTALGALKEAVFVVVPKGGGERAGTVFLNLDFMRGDFRFKAVGLSWQRKLMGVLLGALGLAILVGLFQKLTGKLSAGRSAGASLPPLGTDLLTGLAAALTAACALSIYALGTVPQHQTLLLGLLVSGAGVAIAELFKFAQTKTHLTSGEVFQNFFLTGVLWATASGQVLWQVPTQWDHVMMKSHLAAALVCLIYHGANGVRLATAGKHLRPIAGAILVGTPFLFGALLVLETPALLQSLGAFLVAGKGPAVWAAREMLGRFMVLFVVNELIAQAVGLAAKGQWVKSAKAHGWVALMTLAVVASPTIADIGCGAAVAALPVGWSVLSALVSVMLSQAGLWMEAYFVTGIMLDGLYGYAPNAGAISRHGLTGLKKGMAFSALFMGLCYAIKGVVNLPGAVNFFVSSPIPAGVLLGMLVFPLFKTIIETFDGSMSFFKRAQYSYRQWPLYLRGAAAGGLFALGLSTGVSGHSTGDRLWFGFLAGAAVFGGVSLLRDGLTGSRQKGHIQNVRVYLVESLLGGAIGGLVAFYLDTVQVTALAQKFVAYTSAGLPKTDFTVYSLVSKWGRVDLGGYTGGVKLFYNEALAGLITWSIAAPLFSINRAFMIAYFQKDKAPIRYFFSKAGAAELSVNLIHVMRWGLWMSPIINSGIHMMAEATWYNQDGAIRTLVAIFKNLTLNPADFQLWSLGVFVSLLSYNVLRVLIWIDHMGLRVATLVNLSFLGMDRLDERIARFIGPSAAQRYLPESVKRFTTWAPLLIPFYIPRGQNWDFAWTKSQEIQNAAAEATTFAQRLLALGWRPAVMYVLGGALGVAVLLAGLKLLFRRSAARRPVTNTLANREYKVTVQSDGAAHSQIAAKGFDLTRRSYDVIDPAGRALFLVEKTAGAGTLSWPIMGNAPTDQHELSRLESGPDSIRILNTSHSLRATVEITLPDADSTAERWAVTIENPSNNVRELKVVPYLEWVLDQAGSDRGHTQYVRLFPEMEYVAGSNTVVVNQRKTKTMGFIASDLPTEGFHTSRMDFIGRARSLWSPRLLETMAFLPPVDTKPYPTFDPIGSLLVGLRVEPNSKRTVHFLVGYAKNREQALSMVQSGLKPQAGSAVPAVKGSPKTGPLVGHGEIPPGTPLPYSVYEDGGNTLVVRTPFTPRPYDHALSNNVGHYVMVTNRGLHTTSNGNSQQNPITTDWADTVTREVPSEAFYLFDPATSEWFSPTHHPLNDRDARYTSAFSVEGTARFNMEKGSLSTELTVFVPTSEPTGVYMLTVKNKGAAARRLRVAPCFHIALVGSGEMKRPAIQVHRDASLNAVFFENPGNAFRKGPAFAAMSLASDHVETNRGRFLGKGRGVAHPYLVEKGQPDTTPHWDDRTIAGFLGTLEIPAGEERTVVVVLGQTDNRKMAAEIIRKYKNLDAARESLNETRRWWRSLMSTVSVQTNRPDFDQYQNWLKYQAVAERIWARRGFYQTSGAFGFRDQLQDSVNLIWVDPALARKQIILHASQQFMEGDVVHWFHTLHDMRTAFSSRSHASDNLLWLAWGASEYIRLTGDATILDERTSYLKGEIPFLPLPTNKGGWGMIYLRSPMEDTVYRHCMKSIDLVLEKRMGIHGLPLIGTGDWNDGLDEIGSEGHGESVWLGFFLCTILKNMAPLIEKKDGAKRKDYYLQRLKALEVAVEGTWRGDRYLRAFHDNGAEIGIKGSGVWEIDALTAAWAVYAGINPERNEIVFQTALDVLEKENVILLGWPALREDTKPYLGRSSHYPEGVRENGMYCHGVQWMVRAARLLAEQADANKQPAKAKSYREAAYRLWMKIAPLSHLSPTEIELYGGQPNKQSADMLSTYDQGRMIWHGYTGAAGWMLRQAMEGVVGAQLRDNQVVVPSDLAQPRGPLLVTSLKRDISVSPIKTLGSSKN